MARLPKSGTEKIEHTAIHREQEFRQGIDIHETAVEEFAEGLVGFADPVDRGAAMVILLPFYRQVQHLVIFFLEEIAAQVEGKGPFHDPGGAMETPLREFDSDITGYIEQAVMPNMGSIVLEPADKPAKENRVKRISCVGEKEHRVDQDIFFPFAAGILPCGVEQRDVRVGQFLFILFFKSEIRSSPGKLKKYLRQQDRSLLAEPAAEEIAFVPGRPAVVVTDEETDQEIQFDMGSSGIEIEGLTHIVLRGMIGGSPPVDIGAAAVDGVRADGHEAALDKKSRDAFADKTIVIAADEDDLFGEGVWADLQVKVFRRRRHLTGQAGMKGAIGDDIQHRVKEEGHVEGQVGHNVFFRDGRVIDKIVRAEQA